MLPKRVVRILNFFDLFAFNSGSTRLSSNQQIAYVIQFAHTSIAVIFTFIYFKFLIETCEAYGLFSTINEGLQYSASLLTYWIIVLESHIYRHSHLKFWGIFQQINEHFYQSNAKFHTFRIKHAEFSLMIFLFTTINIFQFGITLLLASYFVLIRMCHTRVFYYIFCLEVIYLQLENIEKEVKKFQGPLNNPNLKKRLKWIREYFHLVHNMTFYFNKICGWSIAVTTLTCFYYVLNALNWIYFSYMYSIYTNFPRKFPIITISC